VKTEGEDEGWTAWNSVLSVPLCFYAFLCFCISVLSVPLCFYAFLCFYAPMRAQSFSFSGT